MVRIFHTEIRTDTNTYIIGYRNVCNKSDNVYGIYNVTVKSQITNQTLGAPTYPETNIKMRKSSPPELSEGYAVTNHTATEVSCQWCRKDMAVVPLQLVNSVYPILL